MNENTSTLEQERRELNHLIEKGYSFEVKDVVFVPEKRFFGLFTKKVRKDVTRKFTVQEPTLATLDRLSAEWIEFAIDDDANKTGEESMQIARRMTKNHAFRCARVIAIAVLGEDRLIPKPHKGGTQWVEDTKQIQELTELFARTVKPSQLYYMYVLISAMCNLGDFMNSIRLLQAERTTMPNRIEENSMV